MGHILMRIAAGVVLGAVAVILIAAVATFLFAIPQFEGAFAMGVAFVWVPMGAIAGALFALLLAKRSR